MQHETSDGERSTGGHELSGFEEQLERIAHKHRLHEIVDSMTDTAKGVFLTWDDLDEDGGYKFNVYGGATVAEAVFAAEVFKGFLING